MLSLSGEELRGQPGRRIRVRTVPVRLRLPPLPVVLFLLLLLKLMVDGGDGGADAAVENKPRHPDAAAQTLRILEATPCCCVAPLLGMDYFDRHFCFMTSM